MTAAHALRTNVPKVRALLVSRLGASRYARLRGDQDRLRQQAHGMKEALEVLLSGDAAACVPPGLGPGAERLRAHLDLATAFLGNDLVGLGFTTTGRTAVTVSGRRPRNETERQLRDAAYRLYEELRAKGKSPAEAWDRITDLVDLNICAVALADERRAAS
jgi:hypothetical protein